MWVNILLISVLFVTTAVLLECIGRFAKKNKQRTKTFFNNLIPGVVSALIILTLINISDLSKSFSENETFEFFISNTLLGIVIILALSLGLIYWGLIKTFPEKKK